MLKFVANPNFHPAGLNYFGILQKNSLRNVPCFFVEKRKGNWEFQNLLDKNCAAFIWQGKSQPKPTDLNSHSTDSTASTSIVFWLQLRGGVMISHNLAFICARWDFCSNLEGFPWCFMVFQGDFKLPSLKASLILGKPSMVFQFLKQQFDMEFSSLQKNIIHLPFPHCDSTSYSGLIRSKYFPAKGGRGFSAVSLGTFSFWFFFFGWSKAITNTSTKAFLCKTWPFKAAIFKRKIFTRDFALEFLHGLKVMALFSELPVLDLLKKKLSRFADISKKNLIPIQPSKSEPNLSRINLLKQTRSSRQFHINIDTFHQTTNHPHHLSCVATDPPFSQGFRSPRKLLMSKEVCECFWEFQNH